MDEWVRTGWMNRWQMDAWIKLDGRMDYNWMDEWSDGWMDYNWMDEWIISGWMDGQIDEWIITGWMNGL